jgi:hypothetical protein
MSNPKFKETAYVPGQERKIDEQECRMYVLVNRPILTLVQSGVQAAHAIAEYSALHPSCENYKRWASTYKTLIFLQATERDIEAVASGLDMNGKKYAKFYEPDMYDENAKTDLFKERGKLTAIAIEPLHPVEGKLLFGKYELLK